MQYSTINNIGNYIIKDIISDMQKYEKGTITGVSVNLERVPYAMGEKFTLNGTLQYHKKGRIVAHRLKVGDVVSISYKYNSSLKDYKKIVNVKIIGGENND